MIPRNLVNEVKDRLGQRLGTEFTPSKITDEPVRDLFRFVTEIDRVLSAPTFEPDADRYLGTISRAETYPLNMTPEMFDIDDIAHSLARTCRYNGHVAGFIPVAEHSVRVALWIERSEEPWFALEGLLHDGWEAYGGDIVNPIKRMPEFAAVLEAETRGEIAMAEHFGLVYPWPDIVKAADKADGLSERGEGGRRYDVKCTIEPVHAKSIFLATYARLMVDRQTVWADKIEELRS